MFTKNDLDFKSIFLINCVEHTKSLKVKNGEFFLEQDGVGLSKFPFPKILALIIIGDATITTPFIDKCSNWGIPIVTTKKNLRPCFFVGKMAEANYLLRLNQYKLNNGQEFLIYAKKLVFNKITNSIKNISLLRGDNIERSKVITSMDNECNRINQNDVSLTELLAIEGRVARKYFSYFFKDFNWQKRMPRVKIDYINVILDIGYTILFNFIECFIRLFGFDCYVGVYHRLWYKRKSLVCDLVEPFRCIIDKIVRKNLKLRVFKEEDFIIVKGQYSLKYKQASDYYASFVSCLTEYKNEIFSYILGFTDL
ncbi:MAG: type V CRISPR-associated endonuclease Cas1 [Succinivibrionaceae bacterium]